MKRPIYLDYNATTPVDPAVVEAMLPYLQEVFGNPSSSHAYGRQAQEAVARARQQVAELLGAAAEEIVFTSGGSEANNLALKGVALSRLRGWFGRWRKGVHLVTCAIEHPATLQPCAFLERLGCQVSILPVDRHGIVDLAALERALSRPTALVSIMHANNEVGTLQPIRQIAELAHAHGALVHTDAAQSVGKVPVLVQELGVDLLSLAGHKVYAPKGIGALYVRRGLTLEPLIHGAGQEQGLRAGTENVPYIVGLGRACELARQSLPQARERLRQLRDRLWHRLREVCGPSLVRHGHPEHCLPNTLSVSFPGEVGSEWLRRVPQVAASTGSACHEGQLCPSPVLRAMGVPPDLAQGTIRLSVGRYTTEEEVDQAANYLAQGLHVHQKK